jgi:hypothetical protein
LTSASCEYSIKVSNYKKGEVLIMKKSLVIIIVIIELIILGTIGALLIDYRLKEIENRKNKTHSSVETEYINKVKDIHESELVIKAFYYHKSG